MTLVQSPPLRPYSGRRHPKCHTVALINMEMIFCPPGTFIMGQEGVDSAPSQLDQWVLLGKYEVTQSQYQTIMNGNPKFECRPQPFKGSNRPVEKPWADAQILRRLNSIEQSRVDCPTVGYVLPTEANGSMPAERTTTTYSWGNDINSSLPIITGTEGQMTGMIPNRPRNWSVFKPMGLFWYARKYWEWTTIGRRIIQAANQTQGPASARSGRTGWSLVPLQASFG